MHHAPVKLAQSCLALSLSIVLQGMSTRLVMAGQPTLVVPTDYPTIQAAIDAAKPGRTVQVLAGTYTEQLAIAKDLKIVGAGMDATIVRAPATLVPGPLGSPAIVQILNGASVSMSGLTVRGPSAGACGDADVLRWGIRVAPGSDLDLQAVAVRDIHNTPMALCFRSGTALSVGSATPGSPAASLSIHDSEITNYQSVGIIVLGAGTLVDITHNTVAGPGHAGGVPTDGIEVVGGAAGTIAHNIVSGNICPANMPEDCGPDFFSQLQHAGIGAAGPGIVISHNRLVGNQMGLFLAEVDEISHNVMVDNDYFGIGLVGETSGDFTVTGGEIQGSGGGLWAVAFVNDVTVVLKKVDFSGSLSPAVETFEDGGFTVTVIGGP